MAKTKQLADILVPQNYRICIIYHYDVKYNPFHIVKKWNGYDKNGRFREHSATMEKYADFHSCLHWLLQNVENYEHRTQIN